MKTSRISKLMVMILIGLVLSVQAKAIDRSPVHASKKTIALSVDKPILEFVAKAFTDSADARDITRMQKMLGQIDYVTVSFRDEDAADYVLKFKTMDEKSLVAWMLDEGYLKTVPETVLNASLVPAVPARNAVSNWFAPKKSVNLTIDKPLVDFIAHAYADQIDASDIVRVQKMAGQVDHITVTFTDRDAADYVLTFKSLTEKELETWMFNEGYLYAAPEDVIITVVPWMETMHLD